MNNKKRSKLIESVEETETPQESAVVAQSRAGEQPAAAREINGPKGLEPTRYGDWESKGRCHDF